MSVFNKLLAIYILMFGAFAGNANAQNTGNKYKEVDYPTPNIAVGKTNDVQGVILHHTAEPTIQSSLRVLTVGDRHVGTHVVIDTDGTRYIMAKPSQVTFHAGNSILAGREGCNNFTIGIEFQGNTLEHPLTTEQINSAIEYLKPLIKQYKIPLDNIVTHEMVRNTALSFKNAERIRKSCYFIALTNGLEIDV